MKKTVIKFKADINICITILKQKTQDCIQKFVWLRAYRLLDVFVLPWLRFAYVSMVTYTMNAQQCWINTRYGGFKPTSFLN